MLLFCAPGFRTCCQISSGHAQDLYRLGILSPRRLTQDFQASDCFSRLIRKIKQDLKLTQIHINSKVKIVNGALE